MHSAIRSILDQLRTNPWIVWLTGCGAYFLSVLHRASLGVAGTEAVSRLDISAAQLGTFLMMQLGIYAAMQIPAGVAIDRFGPRRVLLVATLVVGVAQTGFAFADGYATALLARSFLGVGDAAMYLSVLRIAARWFPARRYAVLTMASGLFGMMGNLAATVPLRLALDAYGWTLTFGFLGAVSIAYSALLLRPAVAASARDRGRRRSRARTATPGLLRQVKETWSLPETRLGFWTHQATMSAGTVLAMVWGFPYLTQGLGMNDAAAAGQISILVAATLVASFGIGPVVGRRPGLRMPLAIGISLGVIGALATLILWPGDGPPVPVVSVMFAVIAVGGPGSQIGFLIARDYNPDRRMATAAGITNSGGFLAAMLGSVLVGVVLDLRSSDPGLDDYRWALATLLLLAVCSTTAMLATLMSVRARVLRRQAAQEQVVVPVVAHWWDAGFARARTIRPRPRPQDPDE